MAEHNWRGREGVVVLAEALVSAHDEGPADAAPQFERAIAIFQQYEVVWHEADALLYWGRALRGAGLRDEALAKFDAVLAIYCRIEAGTPWFERVLRNKLRAQGVDSADLPTSIDSVAASVVDERPDLAGQAAPDGTITLLFSDIQGSTALTERLGDQRWIELLREHNRHCRAAIAAHAGFEVKTIGDAFMVAFRSAREGLRCAIAMQEALAAFNETAPVPLAIRIGLHTGEAVQEADDFFGTHVNLAARIGGAAQGDEILVSGLLKALTESAGEFTFDDGRDVEPKGISGLQRVHAVEWR